jgi:mRNA interferase MazF
MSTQITIRLPDEQVSFIDEMIKRGQATSRAAVVDRALEHEQRRLAAERDIEILAATAGEPDELDGVVGVHDGHRTAGSRLMRPIHLARLNKVRAVLVLTHEVILPHLSWVTVAPITGRIRGLSTEVPVGRRNGLDEDSVISMDQIVTIRKGRLLHRIGNLLPGDEPALTAAIIAAFDLDGPATKAH